MELEQFLNSGSSFVMKNEFPDKEKIKKKI
jgi:hypothetical protein